MISPLLWTFFVFCCFLLFITADNILLYILSVIVFSFILNAVRLKLKSSNVKTENQDYNPHICFHTEMDCQECMSQNHCDKQQINQL